MQDGRESTLRGWGTSLSRRIPRVGQVAPGRPPWLGGPCSSERSLRHHKVMNGMAPQGTGAGGYGSALVRWFGYRVALF